MRQANFEFGFEAEDIPLMIEAIPLNTECIVLIITKVEDPEELDTRFSRFAPSVTEDSDGEDADLQYAENASNEMLDLFRQIQTQQENTEPDSSPDSDTSDIRKHTRIFRMSSLRQVMDVSAVIADGYHGSSTLYKDVLPDGSTRGFLLLLTQGEESAASFDRFCNIVSEYGTPQRPVSGDDAFLAEHYEALVSGNAVHALAGKVS